MQPTRGPLDARLVCPLVAAWAGALLGRYAGRPACAAIAVCAAAMVWRAWRGTAMRWVGAASLACLVASMVGAAWRHEAVGSGPLRRLAAARSVVTLDVVVTGDPVLLDGTVVGARRVQGGVLVPARADAVLVGTAGYRLHQPVTVLGSGAEWTTRLPGERLRINARLSLPRPRDPVTAVARAHGLPTRLQAPGLAHRIAGRLRRGLRDATSHLPSDARGLVPGLVIGDTSRLDDSLREDFRTTGMTHLGAVSGSNCALFLAAALLLTKRLRASPRTTAVAASGALAFFVLLARPSPSVLRAAVMGGVALIALVTGRSRAGLPLLSGSALLLLLADPMLATSPGFALSVAATGGLVVLAPRWRERLGARLPAWLADAVAVPLAAQVACLPVLAGLFGQVSLVAVPANLIAMPVVGVATVAGVVTALAAPVSLPLARLLAWAAGLPALWLGGVARVLSDVPAASVPWPRGVVGALTVSALLLVAPVAGRRRVVRRIALTVVPVIWLGSIGAHAMLTGWPPSGWVLAACDVGQGDGLVVRGVDATLVVDTGPDPAVMRDCLDDLGVRRVSSLVLTHLHADHVEGVPGVLSGRGVAEVVTGPLDEPAEQWRRVQRWVERRRVTLRRATAGERWTVGDVSVEVLAPVAAFRGTDSDPNNSSLVLLVDVRGLRILLTGDVEDVAQRALLDRVAEGTLRATVLKTPHHGSAKQLDGFAAKVGASVAITSVGADNPYGHPARSTMTALRDLRVTSLRTDTHGAIVVGLRRDGSVFALARRRAPAVPALPAPQLLRAMAAPQLFCRVPTSQGRPRP